MRNLAELTDEELAISYMEGDNKAFELLLAHNQSKVFSYILFVVHDEDRANDIFQDTFIKIIAKLQKGLYTPTGKFSAWCMRIAHNVIMDHYRGIRNGHIVEPTEDNDLSNLSGENMEVTNIENDYVNQQVLDDVKKMMRLLPAPQREVVYMRFYQQLSFKEIADVTNVSINTALGRMRYALLNMRKMARDHNLQLQLV
ncbi:MAG: sigma-70 family RNA polymerase sigma factor [Prevotella sp.]|jgi:RNA polymerase sigma-70 factor (ECF subfamily)|nr:sigma-70 family RNA polymerase sigma factor [Prevotella sp.]